MIDPLSVTMPNRDLGVREGPITGQERLAAGQPTRQHECAGLLAVRSCARVRATE